MNELSLMKQHTFLWPTLFVMLIYGLRYLIFAGLMFVVTRPVFGFEVGKTHYAPPASLDVKRHVHRELKYSLITILIFGLVNGVLYFTGWIGASQVYYRLHDYSMLWFWLSIPVMLLLHDTFFYWLHRAMHMPLLFKTMHSVHHQSTHPTAFAAYSFHPTEALAEALIVVMIVYLIPTHPLSILIFQTISTAINVYGHCGKEFYPKGTGTHWLGRWVNTSTTHASHHLRGRDNYGLYLLLWDRWMGTVEKQNNK